VYLPMPVDDSPIVLLGVEPSAGLRAALAERWRVEGPLEGGAASAAHALPPDVVSRIRAIVTYGTATTGAAVVDALPALGVVCCIGSGYEGVDRAAMAARGIAVTHSPGANAASVADLALGLLIASVRRFTAGHALVRAGRWNSGDDALPLAQGLTGRRVGIFGLGAIGARIAARVAACEATVGYHSRRPRAEVPYAYFPTLRALAGWADALVVAVRADDTTRHAVDAGVLQALGADGHVVNIARGSAIDEAALIAALQNGVIAGAGLDVYEHEPVVPAALAVLDNVVLTPHVGGATREAHAAMQALVLQNLAAFFRGEPLPTPVPAA
jgi:lactate dehydrogenase-like 2-hydroxyacid dehydrogenase